MITKNVTLYLGRSPLPVYVNVSQFDTMWAFQFSIIYAGQPWTIPSGANIILNGRKPDGNVFAFSGTVADNVATVNCDVQMTAVAGLVECELSILASGKVVGTANFTLAVEAAPKSPSDISSESTLPAYAELLEVAAGLPDNIPQYITDWLDDHPEATTTVQDGAITPVKLNGAFLDALTIQKTVSGSVASFADGSVLPVKSLIAQIVAQQSGEGDPSPSNIRPITGFTGCTITNNGTAVVTVDWTDEAGTVYGGELDVTTGLLTVTHGYMSFDGTENWGSRGSGNSHFFRLTIDGRRMAASSTRLCSHYRNVTVTTSDTAVGYYAYSTSSANGGYVQIRPENAAAMTTEGWKEWLAAQSSAGTPVQVTWMWETPVTYQLTTTEVATLLGSNALAASTGDISVIYRADPSLVIAALEARVAALEEA